MLRVAMRGVACAVANDIDLFTSQPLQNVEKNVSRRIDVLAPPRKLLRVRVVRVREGTGPLEYLAA
jgi:hypothetical protein